MSDPWDKRGPYGTVTITKAELDKASADPRGFWELALEHRRKALSNTAATIRRSFWTVIRGGRK